MEIHENIIFLIRKSQNTPNSIFRANIRNLLQLLYCRIFRQAHFLWHKYLVYAPLWRVNSLTITPPMMFGELRKYKTEGQSMKCQLLSEENRKYFFRYCKRHLQVYWIYNYPHN